MSLYKAAALPLTDDAQQVFPGTVAMDVLAFGRFASTGTTAPAVIELSPLWPRFLLSVSYAGLSVFPINSSIVFAICHALLFLHGGLDLLMYFSATSNRMSASRTVTCCL